VADSKEKEGLIDDWTPKPLVPELPKTATDLKSRVICGQIGKFVTIDDKKVLNLASHNYLGFSDDADFKEVAIKTLRKYGCGSCGPRGFYGTVGECIANIFPFKSIANLFNLLESQTFILNWKLKLLNF
jgi:hypothetical protein